MQRTMSNLFVRSFACVGRIIKSPEFYRMKISETILEGALKKRQNTIIPQNGLGLDQVR